ncbi:MAG: formyltetrahydrofolate deformylase [Terriglobales bacterium]
MTNHGILLVQCPDQRGIVAALANFIDQFHGDILHADEHQDVDTKLFLSRMEWKLDGFTLDPAEVPARFAPIAEKFGMKWRFELSSRRQKVAIFVSRFDHCLADLLFRHKTGELACDLPLIVSNHPDTRPLAEFHGIPYHEIPVAKDNKQAAEQAAVGLLREHDIELIVLARYMQILSGGFIARYPNRIINIHHSFLPAFIGARPHQRSHERGVKLIGATSHYVTEVLDEGPIIEQDVTRVSHRDTLDSLIQKGRDLERVVLSRAVRWHLENKIMVYGNKTVIFD